MSLLLILVTTVACSPAMAEDNTAHTGANNWVDLQVENVHIGLDIPEGWTAYTDPSHIVLSEHADPMREDGALNCIVVHIWVPTMESLAIETSGINQGAAHVLQEVVKAPGLVDDSAHSFPQAFTWGDHDAAYYLMNDGKGNGALVLALMLPNTTRIVAGRVSAPIDEIERIRSVLPQLFGSMTINNQPLDIASLDHLPDPFVFPDYESKSHDLHR